MNDIFANPDPSPTEAACSVVINDEEQYSIWPAGREIPGGWSAVEIPEQWLQRHQQRHPEQDAKQVCLACIGEVWTDMRPRSVREAVDQQADYPLASGN